MQLYSLKTNERINPLGLDENPFFSWKIKSEKNNVIQTAYRLEIPGVWDSGSTGTTADLVALSQPTLSLTSQAMRDRL